MSCIIWHIYAWLMQFVDYSHYTLWVSLLEEPRGLGFSHPFFLITVCLTISPGFLPTVCEKWSEFFNMHRVYDSPIHGTYGLLKVSSKRLAMRIKRLAKGRYCRPWQDSNWCKNLQYGRSWFTLALNPFHTRFWNLHRLCTGCNGLKLLGQTAPSSVLVIA